jgi:hypothetical protein
MSDSINKLTAKQAEQKIRQINKLGSVIILPHCLKRMEEKNYSSSDIDLLLSKGTVQEPPEYDDKFCQWRYKIKGNAVEGDKATVVVSIKSHRELVCITIMPK